jgi:hypothetical protein
VIRFIIGLDRSFWKLVGIYFILRRFLETERKESSYSISTFPIYLFKKSHSLTTSSPSTRRALAEVRKHVPSLFPTVIEQVIRELLLAFQIFLLLLQKQLTGRFLRQHVHEMDPGYIAVILISASIDIERGISQQDIVFADLDESQEW